MEHSIFDSAINGVTKHSSKLFSNSRLFITVYYKVDPDNRSFPQLIIKLAHCQALTFMVTFYVYFGRRIAFSSG